MAYNKGADVSTTKETFNISFTLIERLKILFLGMDISFQSVKQHRGIDTFETPETESNINLN